MKAAIIFIIGILATASLTQARPQIERLKEAYRAQGDSLFEPLYWLPESRDIVRAHIPDHDGNWVGFEHRRWSKLPEEVKLRVLESLGAELEQMESAKLNATWKRIWDWKAIKQIHFFDRKETIVIDALFDRSNEDGSESWTVAGSIEIVIPINGGNLSKEIDVSVKTKDGADAGPDLRGIAPGSNSAGTEESKPKPEAGHH